MGDTRNAVRCIGEPKERERVAVAGVDRAEHVALGMSELRDAADRVMRKNFPQSRYLAGKTGRDAPWWKLWDPDW